MIVQGGWADLRRKDFDLERIFNGEGVQLFISGLTIIFGKNQHLCLEIAEGQEIWHVFLSILIT